MRSHILARAVAVAVCMVGCTNDSVAPPAPIKPAIELASVTANADNVLSAVVSVSVQHTDSVAVRFSLAGTTQMTDSVTPAVPGTQGTVAIPVLGLLPERHYALQAVAYGPGGVVIGKPLDLVTAALPLDLPRYTAAGSDPSAGFVVFAAGMYGLVIDNTGRVVWYHRFANGPWLNFMAQPNGRYVARQVTTDPTDVEPWVELDPLGNVTRTLSCLHSLKPRFHDLISEPGGGYWILCDETRTMDLTEYGGVASARVTGQAVQHISAAGELLFHWTPFDHFLITDVDSATRAGANVNWTHGNSLDLDADGNLLVSFRNLNEITKIDVRTGSVVWRLGGQRNQFKFHSGATAFAGQHSVRAFGSDRLMLLDNVGDPAESRAERWAIDWSAGVATLIDTYTAVPGVRTLIGGSVQPLPGDRTLVSFGTEGRVEEYDAAGEVRWRIEGTPGYVFRAQRVRSLYRPGIGVAR